MTTSSVTTGAGVTTSAPRINDRWVSVELMAAANGTKLAPVIFKVADIECIECRGSDLRIRVGDKSAPSGFREYVVEEMDGEKVCNPMDTSDIVDALKTACGIDVVELSAPLKYKSLKTRKLRFKR